MSRYVSATASMVSSCVGQRLKGHGYTKTWNTRKTVFGSEVFFSLTRSRVKRTALQGLDACALREANTLRLLELVVDEYGQDEGERGREGGGGRERGRVSQRSGRKRSVGYVVIPFQRRSIVCFRKERDFLLSLIPAFSATALQGYAGTVQHTARSANSHVLPT